jgi:signal transduction histidine kinase
MNKRLFITILLFLLLSASLFTAEPQPNTKGEGSSLEGISELLERWFIVESALYNWQGSTGGINSTAENLFSSLEQFDKILEDFTGSILFIQYEGTGLLPQESGKTACIMTKELTASIKKIVLMESSGVSNADLPAAKTALAKEADMIRSELYSWLSMDSQISSNVFKRLIYIFGVFSVFVIGMIVLTLFLYRALRHSQILEQDSSDFSRTTMLVQEKQRALVSAELHDTVLQDMGRLLQISKDTPSTDSVLSELAKKIMTKTREICRTLMPPDFSRLVLADSLVQLCADFEKRSLIECRAAIDKDFSAEKIPAQMQLQIYRIVQEAFSNIEKHSKAKEVTLTACGREDKALLIYITDDGKGLEPQPSPQGEGSPLERNMANTQSGDGLGIRGMYQRAAILGAFLSFVEGAGSGLTVRLVVPLYITPPPPPA